MPVSRRLRIGRDSVTVCRNESLSSGYTGLSQRRLSRPGEPMLDDSLSRLSTVRRIASAQVCQPLAHRLPKIELRPATSSRWKGCGSYCSANSLISSALTEIVPSSRTLPGCRSSQ